MKLLLFICALVMSAILCSIIAFADIADVGPFMGSSNNPLVAVLIISIIIIAAVLLVIIVKNRRKK